LYSKTRDGTVDLINDRRWLNGNAPDPALPTAGLVKYLKNNPWMNWSVWTLEPNALPGGTLGGCRNIDTDGGLWTAVHWDKLNAIRPIMSPPQSTLTFNCTDNPN
jgi:hypothetical protein